MSIGTLVWRFLVGWLRAIVSSAFLSVSLVTRYNIGANSIDLWYNKRDGKQKDQRWTNTFQRVFAVLLTYLWCRWFFLMQYMPHNLYEDYTRKGIIERQLTYFYEEGLRFNDFANVDVQYIDVPYVLGAMYCIFILVLGLAHVVSIEILRMRGKAVPRLALGQSIVFGFIRNRWKWKYNPYSRMKEWWLLEPMLPIVGAITSFVYGYEVYGWFFTCAAVAMLYTARQRKALHIDILETLNVRDRKMQRWERYLRSHNKSVKLPALTDERLSPEEDVVT